MIKLVKEICCIGAGYVGGPTMAVIADKCPNIRVTVVDINKEKIDLWNHPDINKIPVFEPGLFDLIKNNRGKNLFFSTNLKKGIESADIVFISVNTPTKISGLGAGQASDLKWIEESARCVARYAKGETVIVEKSTIPVRTADLIKTILNSSFSEEDTNSSSFSILSNPEFLSEGSAINDLQNPDRILIGGEDNYSIDLLANIYKKWIPEDKIIRTNLWSSELSKLTANAFLAQRISSINSISALCEVTGADINEVANAVGADTRVGGKFLRAGPGFGGSCFKKDILNLVYLSNYFGLEKVGNYWQEVLNLNQWQKTRITDIIVKKLFGTLSEKKISVLGFAFKENTNDTRESSAIELVKNLIEEKAHVYIHDPKVSIEQIEKDLSYKPKNSHSTNKSNTGSWQFSNDLYENASNADAILIITGWDEYKDINWKKIADLMRKPSWIFDTRSIVNPQDIKETELKLWQLGNGYL